MALTADERDEIIKSIKLGMPLRHVAGLIKLKISVIRQEMAEDPEFKASIRQARSACMQSRLEKLEKSAQWQAATFLLESLWPTQFGRNRKGRRPSKEGDADTGLDLDRLTPEQRRVLDHLLAIANAEEPQTPPPESQGGNES